MVSAEGARTRGGRPGGLAIGAFLFVPRTGGRWPCIALRERLASQKSRKTIRLEAEHEHALTFDDDGAGGRSAGLSNVASFGVLDLDDTLAAGIAEVGRERRGVEQQGVRARFAPSERDHHMCAGETARMEPAIARSRVLEGQRVVVMGAAADEQGAPVGG